MPAERPVETRANEAGPSSLEVSPTGDGMQNGLMVGRRRVVAGAEGPRRRQLAPLALPVTRRTPLLFETTYNPTTLAAERRIFDRRPILWLLALIVLAIAPPLFGNNSFVAAATTFRDVRRDQRYLDADHRHGRHLLARQSRDRRRGCLRHRRTCRCISAFRGGRCGSAGRCSAWCSASSLLSRRSGSKASTMRC